MKQTLIGRTLKRWVVACLLVLLLAGPGAGLAAQSASTGHGGVEHGPKMAPTCNGCSPNHNSTIVASVSGW